MSRYGDITKTSQPQTPSDDRLRGGIRYGLRPSRLPPREHHCIQEVNEPAIDLHLSTADQPTVSIHPRVNIGSAACGGLQHPLAAAHDRQEGGDLLAAALFASVSGRRDQAELASLTPRARLRGASSRSTPRLMAA